MRRLFLALGAVCWASLASAQSTGGPVNMPGCNLVARFTGVSAITKLVSGAGTGKSIFICGWHVTNTAAAGTFSFTYGTQTTNPCDTNSGTYTPALSVSSSAPSADHVQGAQFQVPLNNDLCVTPSVTTETGMIWYSQF